ncbi:MAG: ABC transporter permease [Streptosporangiales bacterium]|nr:ABC transporter permease [Streptosporangiales bacterium]MBO0889823.1 ABC transporter permease [Acidothermales bacterium]
MSTLSYAAADSLTMLRRNLKHQLRYPSLTLMLVGMPIVFLLLFVYVFGGMLGTGLGALSGGRAAYVQYVTPGIVLMTIAGAVQGTAISVAMDMTEGIVARFRTMNIARASVLSAHVYGTIVQTVAGVAVVLGLAVLIGFRPHTGTLGWLALAGVVALTTLALGWLTVALGVSAKSVETASNTPMPLMLLPFLSSAFVPTDSMPTVMRWFAEYQPFTPVTETIRGLLLGTPVGHEWIAALAWCAGLTLVGYLLTKRVYDRKAVGYR